MQALLTKFGDSCFHSLTKNLTIVSDDPSLEGVHSLRLSIKKIRALLTLLDQDITLKESEILKQIDNIFHYSGQLRDMQVQVILLETYRNRVGEVVDIFQEIIGKEKRKVKKLFKDQINRINLFDLVLFNQSLDNCIEALSCTTLESNCKLKVEQSVEQIILMFSDNQEDKNLHRIRIKLKELIYFLSILKKGKIVVKYDSDFRKRLNYLQQKLGDWHDLDILLDRIISMNKHHRDGSILLYHLGKDKNAVKLEIIASIEKLSEESKTL